MELAGNDIALQEKIKKAMDEDMMENERPDDRSSDRRRPNRP
jgi:hypothetical protein